MIKEEEMTEEEIGTTEIAIMTEIVITGIRIVVTLAGANTHALVHPADPTGKDMTEIVKTTDAETPVALQRKEAATITLLIAEIDHDISLPTYYRLLTCSYRLPWVYSYTFCVLFLFS